MNEKPSLPFKENLQLLLKQKKLKVSTLARELGMNKSTLHNYLNGSVPQSVKAIKKLATFFNLEVDELVFHSLKKKKESNDEAQSLEGEYVLTIYKKESQ